MAVSILVVGAIGAVICWPRSSSSAVALSALPPRTSAEYVPVIVLPEQAIVIDLAAPWRCGTYFYDVPAVQADLDAGIPDSEAWSRNYRGTGANDLSISAESINQLLQSGVQLDLPVDALQEIDDPHFKLLINATDVQAGYLLHWSVHPGNKLRDGESMGISGSIERFADSAASMTAHFSLQQGEALLPQFDGEACIEGRNEARSILMRALGTPPQGADFVRRWVIFAALTGDGLVAFPIDLPSFLLQ